MGEIMVDITTVPGKRDKYNVMLYTISTCIWCKRLKSKLNENEIKYSYIDIDLTPWSEREKIKQNLVQFRARLAFPMMFVDDNFIPNDEIDQKIIELSK